MPVHSKPFNTNLTTLTYLPLCINQLPDPQEHPVKDNLEYSFDARHFAATSLMLTGNLRLFAIRSETIDGLKW